MLYFRGDISLVLLAYLPQKPSRISWRHQPRKSLMTPKAIRRQIRQSIPSEGTRGLKKLSVKEKPPETPWEGPISSTLLKMSSQRPWERSHLWPDNPREGTQERKEIDPISPKQLHEIVEHIRLKLKDLRQKTTPRDSRTKKSPKTLETYVC